jgi:hypothetical protein
VKDTVGTIDVSTMNTWDHGWETCLFSPDTSEVVANYSSETEAAKGHWIIVNTLKFALK